MSPSMLRTILLAGLLCGLFALAIGLLADQPPASADSQAMGLVV